MDRILDSMSSAAGDAVPDETEKQEDKLVDHKEASVNDAKVSEFNGNMDDTPTVEDDVPEANGSVDDDINDVMEVLTDLAGEDFHNGPKEASNASVDALTSVQDVSKVVDKAIIDEEPSPAALAEDRYAKASARQISLEKRLANITRRINLIRCRKFGSHVAQELGELRTAYEMLSPPQTAPPVLNLAHISSVTDFSSVQGQNQVTLPSYPLAPAALASQVVKDEPLDDGSGNKKKVKKLKKELSKDDLPPVPTESEKQGLNEALGRLNVNLRHLIQSYDSEATESSSGGESCDEGEGFDVDALKTIPIRKRAKYTWLKNRAGIASRWTWLTAQIADLEYRIRQQTVLYQQIRSIKGQVSLGEQQKSDVQPNSSLKVDDETVRHSDLQAVFKCEDDTGRKVVIKGPADPVPDDDDLGAARTRPIKPMKRRCVLSTQGFYRLSSRAGKESNVLCGCLHPLFSCAICYGRANHFQSPETAFHDRAKTLALLDHSYHQVLSRPRSDVNIEIALAQKLKNRTWIFGSPEKAVKNKDVKEKKKKNAGKSRKNKNFDDEFDEVLKSTKKSKKLKDNKRKLKRRKSVTVHHHADGVAINDINDYDDSNDAAVATLPTPSSHLLTMEQIRRRRETSFDIDNIVIPYSTMASARVEKLKYKEIQTPYWREVTEGANGEVKVKEEEKDPPPKPPSPVAAAAEEKPVKSDSEDISEHTYFVRHSKAEIEEQARWKTAVGTGGQRSTNSSRSRRQDSRHSAEASSGCNTPDPMSPGVVDTLEVTTRPSTPDEGATAPVSTPATPTLSASAGSIRNRRRTSSATRSRDRNPSEDASNPSRCTTPVYQYEVPPYEPRQFPLTELTYDAMLHSPSENAMAVFIDQQPPKSIVKPAANRRVSLTSPQVVISRLRMSRDSSIDEDDEEEDLESDECDDEEMLDDEDLEEEEDPEWLEDDDDPDDPEWTAEREVEEGAAANAAQAPSKPSTSKKSSNSKK